MRYISEEDVSELLKLHQDGWTMKFLAQKFHISEATVSNYIHGRTAPRYIKKRNRNKRKEISAAKPQSVEKFVEIDFSELPNEVLFEHVRESQFIG